MENCLEYDLLPLPGEVTHQIILACHKDAGVSLQQMSGLRLVNKTWKAAVEAGLFGLQGRLMYSPRSTKFALLVGNSCDVNWFRVRPAIGLLDDCESSEFVYVHPLDSRNSIKYHEGTCHVSVLNRSIYILQAVVIHFKNPRQPASELSARTLRVRNVRVHSFQSGEWKTDGVEDAVRRPIQAYVVPRFCAGSGGRRVFYVGQYCGSDVSGRGQEYPSRILAYEPRMKQWTLLPRIEKECVIHFCYTFEGQLYAVIIDYYKLLRDVTRESSVLLLPPRLGRRSRPQMEAKCLQKRDT